MTTELEIIKAVLIKLELVKCYFCDKPTDRVRLVGSNLYGKCESCEDWIKKHYENENKGELE